MSAPLTPPTDLDGPNPRGRFRGSVIGTRSSNFRFRRRVVGAHYRFENFGRVAPRQIGPRPYWVAVGSVHRYVAAGQTAWFSLVWPWLPHFPVGCPYGERRCRIVVFIGSTYRSSVIFKHVQFFSIHFIMIYLNKIFICIYIF